MRFLLRRLGLLAAVSIASLGLFGCEGLTQPAPITISAEPLAPPAPPPAPVAAAPRAAAPTEIAGLNAVPRAPAGTG